jgi:hypothetical protein
VKISKLLFLSGSLLGLALPMAHAGDEPLTPALPPAYDLMTLSRGPAKVIPGLDPRKDQNDTATILSVVPSTGDSAGTRIEWSGRITTGIVYKNTRNK